MGVENSSMAESFLEFQDGELGYWSVCLSSRDFALAFVEKYFACNM